MAREQEDMKMNALQKILLGSALTAAGLAAACVAAPALAQASYPTAASGVRVPGTVPLQCDASGANCAPAGAANPASVQGNVAGAATDAGNPIKIGCAYYSTTATYTNGQRTECQTDSRGAIHVSLVAGGATAMTGAAGADGATNSVSRLYTDSRGVVFNGTSWDRARGDANGAVTQPALSSAYWAYAAASGGIANTTTAVTIKAAGGASVRNYLCGISVAHDALGAATELAVRDGAAGTVIWRGRLQTAATDSAAGAGTITFSPCLRGTANTLLEVVTLTAVTGGVFVNAQGFSGI